MSERLPLDRSVTDDELAAAVTGWVERHVPEHWRVAAADGHDAVREVRSVAEYEAWYPTFADSISPTPRPAWSSRFSRRSTSAA